MREACLFCEGKIFPYALGVRDHRRIASKDHDFFQCQICGSLRLAPLPRRNDLAQSYPVEYQFTKESKNWLRKLWNGLEWKLFYQPILGLSVKSATLETGVFSGRVLDIGCGSGLRLLQFANAGFEPEGMDFSSPNLLYAKEVLGLKVSEGDLEEADLPINRYHLLTAYFVLEHLLDPGSLVEKVRNTLGSKGWAIFAVPLSDSWVCALFRGHWDQIREAPRHISIPSSRGMSVLLERSGFKKIKSKPASTLELAGDVALTLWPRGSFFMTTGRWAFLKILDRMIVALLTLVGIPLVVLLRTLGIKQGLTVFFAQKGE